MTDWVNLGWWHQEKEWEIAGILEGRRCRVAFVHDSNDRHGMHAKLRGKEGTIDSLFGDPPYVRVIMDELTNPVIFNLGELEIEDPS